MATKTTADTNFYQTWVDSQKKMIDNMTESASQLAKNAEVNETLHKGSDLYKNWLDNQLSFMNEQTEKMKDAKTAMTTEEITATSKEWMENQMKMTKEFMEFSMNTMKNHFESTLKSFPMLNGNADKMKTMFNDNMNLYKEWNDTLNKSYDEMMKNFKPGTAKDAMSGMLNMKDSYAKFAELWAPFMKSMQEKTFNAEMFKTMMNPSAYNEMFSKMFPTNSNPFSTWTNMMNMNNFTNMDWMKNMMNPTANPFGNWASMMNPTSNPFGNWANMMNPSNPFANMTNMFGNTSNPMGEWMKMFNTNTPGMDWMKNWNTMSANFNTNPFQVADSSEMFGNMMTNYNNIYASTQQMFAPMFKMMTSNQAKMSMEAFSSLANKMVQYNLKSAEMQALTYKTGMTAMQKVAEQMQAKISKGEDFKGINTLYQEWLNTSDKVFVELFESQEYSKVQGEVASLQHNIKKESEAIMEKMMVNVPVITRSEMDESYKTIHDLKKRVNELEKALEANTVAVKAPVNVAPNVKKSSK